MISLHSRIVRCRACPRLVGWREEVARNKVARFKSCEYWGRPVPGFGDPAARILLVGLAPGAHGANRTGRMFTGDRSGDFLFAAMHRAGLATQSISVSRSDGLELKDAYIVAAIRCAPPKNRPEADEIARCSHFLDEEIAFLPEVQVFLALGAIAWRACLDHLVRTSAAARSDQARGRPTSPATSIRPRPPFAHGAIVPIGRHILMGSFHVSQQNTQTGKLTRAMFDGVLARAKELVNVAVPDATKR
jgi:uracil-DNA glycosylase family 4